MEARQKPDHRDGKVRFSATMLGLTFVVPRKPLAPVDRSIHSALCGTRSASVARAPWFAYPEPEYFD